jgi:hypothetical protein
MGTFVIVEYLKMISGKNEPVGWVVLDSTVNRLSELYYYYMNNLNAESMDVYSFVLKNSYFVVLFFVIVFLRFINLSDPLYI